MWGGIHLLGREHLQPGARGGERSLGLAQDVLLLGIRAAVRIVDLEVETLLDLLR
jgi:hypothetical protein